MHAYVISLKGCSERRAPLIEELERQSVGYSIVEGVDGRHELPSEYEALIDRKMARQRLGRDLTDAECACALSHRLAYQRLIDDDLPEAVILEDDAVIVAQLCDLLKSLGSISYDFILLDHESVRTATRPGRKVADRTQLFRVANIPDLTTAYVIKREAARAVLSDVPKIGFTADWPFDISALRTFALLPRPITHPISKDGSLIASQRAFAKDNAFRTAPKRPYKTSNLSGRIRRAFARAIE